MKYSKLPDNRIQSCDEYNFPSLSSFKLQFAPCWKSIAIQPNKLHSTQSHVAKER